TIPDAAYFPVLNLGALIPWIFILYWSVCLGMPKILAAWDTEPPCFKASSMAAFSWFLSWLRMEPLDMVAEAVIPLTVGGMCWSSMVLPVKNARLPSMACSSSLTLPGQSYVRKA